VVKVKVKVKFTLEQAMKAREGVEIWRYSFFNLSARWGEGGQCHVLATGKETWYPLTGGWVAENLAPT